MWTKRDGDFRKFVIWFHTRDGFIKVASGKKEKRKKKLKLFPL